MKRIPDEVRQNIRKARERGGTIGDIVEVFGFSKSTVWSVIKDCDDSNVQRASPSRKRVQEMTPVERPDLSKSDLGEASRQMICARLMLAGVKVFRPMTEDTPIDLLVVSKDGVVLKLQCKTIWPATNGSHTMALYAMRKNKLGERSRKHKYGNDEVDYFVGYCYENDAVYVIPYGKIGGRQTLTFWVMRQPIGASATKRFDHERFREVYDDLK